MTEHTQNTIPNLIIRGETPADFQVCEEVVREAFYNRYAPGCSEHLVLHQARKAPDFEPWHSLVAEYEGNIIGQVLLVPALIEGEEQEYKTFTIGPVCTLPACYHRGIGSALMRAMIQTAKEHGAQSIFLMGDPKYYHRFGFVSASKYGIHLPGMDKSEEAAFFMALPLREGALEGVSGIFMESDVYKTDEETLKEYDKRFPKRKAMKLPGQLQ